ncbi:hypothetical protein H6F89_34400 [Cyanobacteria bacterium FACHB-63]|nr:hypothetical protein [Cyanobacteria bacterium FACHB-63]
MRSIREAVARVRRSKKESPSPIHFRLEEVQQRIGTQSEKLIRADLKQLAATGLLSFTKDAITISTLPLNFAQPLLERLGRSMRRLIPVPRRLLEFLAQCRCPSVLRGIIVYLLRGLAIRQGIIHACGSVKSSWVAQIADISLRAAKFVRARLIQIGWLSKDVGSTQRKLNATGAYFRINTEWRCPVDNSPRCNSQSASPPLESAPKSAPPIQNLKTSKKCKDQKLSLREPNSGVCQRSKESPLTPPVLKNIQAIDLQDFLRLEALYWQALAAKWLTPCEANVLNWISAAVRSREVVRKGGGDAVRVFVAIVRRKLWNTITGAQEDYARQTLARFRAMYPKLYRSSGLGCPKWMPLSFF